MWQSGVLSAIPAQERLTFAMPTIVIRNHDFARAPKTIPNSIGSALHLQGEAWSPTSPPHPTRSRCLRPARRDNRAYLPRARWIRDANDSYVAA